MTERRSDRPDAPGTGDGIAKPPLCDELSGGGGSATDTRTRGQPGGSPGGAEKDCDPIAAGRPQPRES
ncbi:hypothetical protein [Azospirillum halopraeferens]|uniref:hypothetical protein n=1 Tax=Azospirillum halopraeferens TaxID=34010 RepID=UPI0004249C97|nr:hypothetical protein [Azospirillum halopraeferens]